MKFNNFNVQVSPKSQIGKNVKIGDNTVIYDNVVIGDNTIICNDCILGEPLNSYYHSDVYENPVLKIGKDSLIRSHSIFYAGSEFGLGLQTGHRVTVREYTVAGNNCQIGSYSDIQGDCHIGNYVKMQSFVNIGQRSQIGDYVFIFPYTVLTNDPIPPSNVLEGVRVGSFSVIASGCVILPGAIIGEHCMTAANSTVGGTYKDDVFIAGMPAKVICPLSKAPFFDRETKKRHYPWPFNFRRGMPWEKIGYEEWIKKKR